MLNIIFFIIVVIIFIIVVKFTLFIPIRSYMPFKDKRDQRTSFPLFLMSNK